jgi:hypothetical protein
MHTSVSADAGDEARHEAFYTALMSAVLDQDPIAAWSQ